MADTGEVMAADAHETGAEVPELQGGGSEPMKGESPEQLDLDAIVDKITDGAEASEGKEAAPSEPAAEAPSQPAGDQPSDETKPADEPQAQQPVADPDDALGAYSQEFRDVVGGIKDPALKQSITDHLTTIEADVNALIDEITTETKEATDFAAAVNAVIPEHFHAAVAQGGPSIIERIQRYVGFEDAWTRNPAGLLRELAGTAGLGAVDVFGANNPDGQNGASPAANGAGRAGVQPQIDPNLARTIQQQSERTAQLEKQFRDNQRDNLASSIEAWGTEAGADGKPLRPYWADVGNHVAQLVAQPMFQQIAQQSGDMAAVAAAYDAAVRLDDNIFAKIQAEKAEGALREAREKADAAKASGAAPLIRGPAEPPPSTGRPKSLDEAAEQAAQSVTYQS